MKIRVVTETSFVVFFFVFLVVFISKGVFVFLGSVDDAVYWKDSFSSPRPKDESALCSYLL